MEIITPSHHKVFYGGTYNGHQLALAAASVVLEKLKTGKIQKRLHQLTGKPVNGFNDISKNLNIKVRLQGFGGRFQIYFALQQVIDWRTACGVDRKMYVKFRDSMAEKGILLTQNCFSHNGIIASHTNEDIKTILATSGEILGKMTEKVV